MSQDPIQEARDALATVCRIIGDPSAGGMESAAAAGRFVDQMQILLPAVESEIEILRTLIEESASREAEYVTDIGNRDEEIQDREVKIEWLEEAFRKIYVNELVGAGIPRDIADAHVREALEELKR